MSNIPSAEHLGLNEEWLERRFELFNDVCLSSVAKQTSQSFCWLIYLDALTPKKYVDRMEAWSKEYDFLNPIYCEQMREGDILKEMNNRACDSHLRVTTRLDNDDALHPGFIEKTQQIVNANCDTYDLKKGFFISFPMGYSEHKGDFYIQRFRYNPFVSFVSDSAHNKTVLGWEHTRIMEIAPVVFKYSSPMWCQVIHGENLGNAIRGIYWPWGNHSKWVSCATGSCKRRVAWRIAEFWRSLRKYLLGK